MAFIEFTKDGGRLYLSAHIGKPQGGPRALVLGQLDYDLADLQNEFDDLMTPDGSYAIDARLSRFLEHLFGKT